MLVFISLKQFDPYIFLVAKKCIFDISEQKKTNKNKSQERQYTTLPSYRCLYHVYLTLKKKEFIQIQNRFVYTMIINITVSALN